MNRLEHLREFQDILAHYQMSEDSKRTLAETRLALLAAPTSAGRNTIIRELVKTGDFDFIVSDTTRRPRVNDTVLEQNGINYWFRTEEQVLADLKAGKFLEAAIIHNQQVSGISVRELKRIHDSGKIGTTDIEIVGVRNIMRAKPDTFAIFVLPPSFDEWQHRLKHRGRMSRAEYRRRLDSAVEEFKAALDEPYYSFVINDTVDNALHEIQEIVHTGKLNPEQQMRGRALAKQLYTETKTFLSRDL